LKIADAVEDREVYGVGVDESTFTKVGMAVRETAPTRKHPT